MAKPISTITVSCPQCTVNLTVPIAWSRGTVHRPGEIRIVPTPDLSAVKTHMLLHLPSGPDDGLPIAS